MNEFFCCISQAPAVSWIKTAMPVFAAILSFLLALIVLPIIRARNEKKRLSSLKVAVVLWLELISLKISNQIANLEEFIQVVKEKRNPVGHPFSVVDIQIDHLLGYNDDDLRKVLYEKLEGNASAELYVDILNNIRFVKAHQKHLEETYDKWHDSLDDNQYLPIFEICLTQLKTSKEPIDKYLSESKNSSIKSDWWIWT